MLSLKYLPKAGLCLALVLFAQSSFSNTSIRSTSSSSSSSSSSVRSLPANHAPVADFTWVAAGASVHVESVNVFDVDGDKLTYQFDFGDGKSVKYPTAWHSYKTPGVYTITQTVSDGRASTVHRYDVLITAVTGNHAPVAIFSYDSSNLSAHVNGSASADIENSALTFTWDLGNGPLASTDVKKIAFTAPEGGTLVTLTVFDGDLGNTVQAFVPAKAGQSWDFVPSAVFTTSVDGSFLKVNASDSSGADSFTWDFGDGGTGTGIFASHNYTTPGTYTVKLHATSGMMSSNATTTIVANASTNHPPVPCFSINGNNLTASLLATCSTDADWDNLTFDWDFGDGGKSTGSYTGHIYQVAGTYPITLKVSDGKDTRSLTKSFTATMLPKPTRCEFRVNAEWENGYIGWVRVFNQSASPVTGWNVILTYNSSANRINNFWNTSVTGSNPYSLNPESWNGTIAPGAYAEIGFVGIKNGFALEIPVLSGLSCK